MNQHKIVRIKNNRLLVGYVQNWAYLFTSIKTLQKILQIRPLETV
ncbi:hypothetical protein [Haemophilus parahaemolyticus]